MIKILPYILDCIMIFGGLFAALLGFKVINLKIKKPEDQEKMVIWHKKFDKLMKIGGIVLLIIGLLNVVFPSMNALNFDNNKAKGDWTQEQKDEMVIKVINSINSHNSINSDTVRLISKCFVDKYTEKYTLDDAWKQDKMTQEQQMNIAQPIMQDCLKQYGIKTNK